MLWCTKCGQAVNETETSCARCGCTNLITDAQRKEQRKAQQRMMQTRPQGMNMGQPMGQPMRQPSGQPMRQPVGQPNMQSNGQKMRQPAGQSDRQPIRQNTEQTARQTMGQFSQQVEQHMGRAGDVVRQQEQQNMIKENSLIGNNNNPEGLEGIQNTGIDLNDGGKRKGKKAKVKVTKEEKEDVMEEGGYLDSEVTVTEWAITYIKLIVPIYNIIFIIQCILGKSKVKKSLRNYILVHTVMMVVVLVLSALLSLILH